MDALIPFTTSGSLVDIVDSESYAQEEHPTKCSATYSAGYPSE